MQLCICLTRLAPELCHKGDFSPNKRMKGMFVYVLEFMLTLAKMHNKFFNVKKFESETVAF